MQKFIDKLTEWSEKLSQMFFLKVIMGGFVMIMPMTLIGSIASLINGITISGFQDFLINTGIGGVLGAIYQFTIGLMGVYIAFCMAHSAAEQLGMKKQAISVGLVSLVSFLIITPYEDGVLPTQWLGATGMFSAIIGIFWLLQESLNSVLIKRLPSGFRSRYHRWYLISLQLYFRRSFQF